MTPRALLRRALGFAIVFGVVVAKSVANARPGGGHSFSGGYHGGGFGGGGGYHYSGGGGGYHFGGGGGGASGDPVVVLFIIAAYFVYVVIAALRKQAGGNWSAGSSGDYAPSDWVPPPVRTPNPRWRARLDAIRTFDPEFSTVLFEDFVYSLYAVAHDARGRHTLESLAPYIAPEARESLAALGDSVTEVRGVVVGAMRYVRVEGADGTRSHVTVVVEFESNYTEIDSAGRQSTWYVVERWRFVRARTATSRSPDRATVLACPNCGAPLEQIVGGTCSYCHRQVDSSAFDWGVAVIETRSRDARGATLTGGTVEEQGTDLPTVFDPYPEQGLRALAARDPQFSYPAFELRVVMIFGELQVAWSSWKWDRARAFLSDRLFETQAYWIEMYRRAGLRNVTADAGIQRAELVRVASDKWFDAITVRIYASSLDYTVDAQNHVVGGSKTVSRAYSEYWTLIRGAQRTGAARADRVCPNCGAALAINMAGHCEYCKVKVTTGDFDWVLSRIEQDEAYTG